jgi:hypothetical protein
MLSLLAATAILASAPRALPGSEAGIHIPRLDGMSGVLAFMGRAGERSVMLRPSTWFSEAHPVFMLDLTRPQTLAELGLDPSGPATLSHRKDGRMTCHGVSEPARFDERARARLSAMGALWEGKVRGVPALGAAAGGDDPRLVAAVVRRGNVACAVGSRADARALLEAAANATGKPQVTGAWATLAGLKGTVFMISGDAALGLTGARDELVVDGRARKLPAPGLSSGTQSPYAGFAPPGLAVVRAAVRQKDVPGAVRSLIAPLERVCRACPREPLAALERALSAQLTGQVALFLQAASVRGRLRTEADRFFAARHVWLAEVKDPAEANKALSGLEKVEGARTEDGVWVVPVDSAREVRVGVSGRHLFLANDPGTLEVALAALPQKPAKLARGLEATVDPARAHQALSGISLMDVLGSKELAGLLAVSTEVGPVLELSQSLTGWAQSDGSGGHRFGAVLTLRPPE